MKQKEYTISGGLYARVANNIMNDAGYTNENIFDDGRLSVDVYENGTKTVVFKTTQFPMIATSLPQTKIAAFLSNFNDDDIASLDNSIREMQKQNTEEYMGRTKQRISRQVI